MSENGSSVGAVAEFTCNDGYVMIGESRIYCQQDGNWSSQPPVCQGKTSLRLATVVAGR